MRSASIRCAGLAGFVHQITSTKEDQWHRLVIDEWSTDGVYARRFAMSRCQRVFIDRAIAQLIPSTERLSPQRFRCLSPIGRVSGLGYLALLRSVVGATPRAAAAITYLLIQAPMPRLRGASAAHRRWCCSLPK